jgi:hypothetical protein
VVDQFRRVGDREIGVEQAEIQGHHLGAAGTRVEDA